MAVRKDTAKLVLGALAILALLAALNFFGVKVADAIPNLWIGLFTIAASLALVTEVGINKIRSGEIRNDPVAMISTIIAGLGILSAVLLFVNVTTPILSTIGGIINLVLAVFLLIEIKK